MSEPTNSASGVEPAADTLFADLENTQPPYDPEYDAHIPPEDTSAPEEDPSPTNLLCQSSTLKR